jgi:hypothetical protein
MFRPHFGLPRASFFENGFAELSLANVSFAGYCGRSGGRMRSERAARSARRNPT